MPEELIQWNAGSSGEVRPVLLQTLPRDAFELFADLRISVGHALEILAWYANQLDMVQCGTRGSAPAAAEQSDFPEKFTAP